MISARRAAREWALKILYQADVGKMSVEESQEAALDRLRREFVHKGTRAAAGSLVEEYCLDVITSKLTALMPKYRPPLDAAIRESISRIFHLNDFWERLEIDFAFSRQSFNALLDIPRHPQPIALPAEVAALPPAILTNDQLTSTDRAEIRDFLEWARHAIPAAALRAFTREALRDRPVGAGIKVTEEYVQEKWRNFTRSMADRWVATGHIVEKQASDWMKVASFTLKLVSGVHQYQAELDARLQSLASGWAIDRQVSVDRNILRMAALELTHLEGIPASATINEAVELAKKYSTAESGRFVNGVLGALAAQCGAPDVTIDTVPDTEFEAEVSADEHIDLDDSADEEELAHV